MELEPEPQPLDEEELEEEALQLLDEIDGTAIARKIDEAAFIQMFIQAPPRRGEGSLGSTRRSAGDVLWLVSRCDLDGDARLSADEVCARLYLRLLPRYTFCPSTSALGRLRCYWLCAAKRSAGVACLLTACCLLLTFFS